MIEPHVEYVGFTTRGTHRVYTLRIRRVAEEPEDFNVLIDSAAFLAKRVRYQDGPEISFLKLQKELLAANGGKPQRELAVTDSDLADYKAAHTPKPPQRRPRPPLTNT
jgi:hypothetical protein